MNNKQKKLILLTSEFPYGTGETFLENELPFLSDSFEDIIIFTERKKGESRINNSSIQVHLIHSIGWKSRISSFFNKEFYRELNYISQQGKFNVSTFRTAWYSLSKALSIAKQLESIGEAERVIFYSYWLDEKAIALALLKKKNPILKAVSRAHGWDIYEERHINNYLPYRNLVTGKLDVVYSISENGKSYLINQYPEFKNKIQLSRLGTLPLKSIPKRTMSNTIHILSISSLIPLKRVDKILELVSSIPNFNIKWTQIGIGPAFEKVRNLALESVQSSPNFSFDFLGQLSNSHVREILSTHYFDLFVNLSETEGIPVTIMEAQSAGTTVLATNVGGTSEIVNNENGFLVVKDFNMGEVVSTIKNYLYCTNEEKQKKRHASYENWKQNFNAEINYNDFVKKLITPEAGGR